MARVYERTAMLTLIDRLQAGQYCEFEEIKGAILAFAEDFEPNDEDEDEFTSATSLED